jgi:hypothetical protein
MLPNEMLYSLCCKVEIIIVMPAAITNIVNFSDHSHASVPQRCYHEAQLLIYPCALQRYSNHDIVNFLESIGASFGACQNAYTSADETVYTLMVPTADSALLDKSIAVLSEFAARIRYESESPSMGAPSRKRVIDWLIDQVCLWMCT